MDERLAHLARLCGIGLAYSDVFGADRPAEQPVLVGVLAAMGVRADSPDAVEASIAAVEAAAIERTLPQARVVYDDQPQWAVRINLAPAFADKPLRWQLDTEQGELRQEEFVAAALRRIDVSPSGARTGFELRLAGGVALGYHRLSLWSGDEELGTCSFIVAPRRCYHPPDIADGGRVWGLTTQLYSLRSPRNWGIGDFSDLAVLVETAATHGAALVGINPLHALFPHDPSHANPYSPSSRLFLNVLYLDVERVAEAQADAASHALIHSSGFQQRLQGLRAGENVDYPAVAAAKREVLESLFEHFRHAHQGANTPCAQAFRQWCDAAGQALREHALFEALQEHFARTDASIRGWPAWPEAYRRPETAEVQAFAREHADRVEFHAYLQWLADAQFAAAGHRSYELGLGVGLYADLAVSVDRGGAETWANQDLYAVDASIGAPPDDLNVGGQDWGLAPIVPRRLQAHAFKPWIATLRANMRHAGALRIDHVMALLRLYWIPRGASPAQGIHVHYPFEELLGIVALESQRNRCLVIGADLATVPDAVREGLAAADVLSYRLFYFERDETGGFLSPHRFPQRAIVAAATHDLPPLAGWWAGRDLQVRDSLGLFLTPGQREQQLVQRAQDRTRLLIALEREGLLPQGIDADALSVPSFSPPLCRALHRLLARTPAHVVVAQLEDIFGTQEQVHLPGTTDQHPNWRRKLPPMLAPLAADERLVALARMFTEERPPRRVPARRRATVVPRATYRVQLHAQFGFNDARAIVPYLAALGVSHLYCSPFLRARPGSLHGYDIIDHNELNPEIGDRADFERLVAALKSHGMGLLMDVVPNHMGVLGGDNAWWTDVLENGPASAFAEYFDIDWEAADPDLTGRVLLPILGEQYGIVLERGELRLVFDADSGGFALYYYAHRLPLDPATYPVVLDRTLATADGTSLETTVRDAVASLAAALQRLPARTATAAGVRAERQRDTAVHKAALARLVREHPALGSAIAAAVAELNGTANERASYDALDGLITAQAYRLAYWRVAADEINYRRFFDINDLAALRMEIPAVFDATHRLVLEMLADGKVDGLRVDHPDGLLDPQAYFERLQRCFAERVHGVAGSADGRPLFVLAEKIVAPHEQLPTDWAVHGTTGYRFANVITGLFVDAAAKSRLDRAWRAFVGAEAEDFEVLAYECKRLVITTSLAGQLTVLAGMLLRLARADRRTRDFSLNALRQALAEVVACFPVYRTYIVERPSAQDRRWIDWAVARARRTSRAADASVLDFIHAVLAGRPPPGADAHLHAAYLAFARRLQQFTAPVAAKGIEDTAFYRHHRLVALNEVGGDPDVFGFSVSAFHGASRDRAQRWPHTMLATTTHDTKRSEDVRARIAVLSEQPAIWRLAVRRWSRINRRHRGSVDGRPAPARNDEYLIYQTLVGTLPPGPLDDAALARFRERIVAYMLKATREAKVHTSWISPSAEYEAALAAFIHGALARSAGNLFLDDLREAVATFGWYGALNSLAMTLLKFASPGVPDLYQGQEILDLSLVDPDNRRPVDFVHCEQLLQSLRGLAATDDPATQVAALCATPEDGRAKAWITWRALQLRRAQERLFRAGDYAALAVEGPRARHVVAFCRRLDNAVLVAVSARLFAQLGDQRGALPTAAGWRGTTVALPGLGTLTLRDALTDRVHQPLGEVLQLERVLGVLPFALLHGQIAGAPVTESGHAGALPLAPAANGG